MPHHLQGPRGNFSLNKVASRLSSQEEEPGKQQNQPRETQPMQRNPRWASEEVEWAPAEGSTCPQDSGLETRAEKSPAGKLTGRLRCGQEAVLPTPGKAFAVGTRTRRSSGPLLSEVGVPVLSDPGAPPDGAGELGLLRGGPKPKARPHRCPHATGRALGPCQRFLGRNEGRGPREGPSSAWLWARL